MRKYIVFLLKQTIGVYQTILPDNNIKLASQMLTDLLIMILVPVQIYDEDRG